MAKYVAYFQSHIEVLNIIKCEKRKKLFFLSIIDTLVFSEQETFDYAQRFSVCNSFSFSVSRSIDRDNGRIGIGSHLCCCKASSRGRQIYEAKSIQRLAPHTFCRQLATKENSRNHRSRTNWCCVSLLSSCPNSLLQ